MWYAVVTVFIDGKYFDSKCAFVDGDTSPVGHCYASIDEEPLNSCKREFWDRIEIHTDWFENEELAHKFCEGKIVYKHIYDTYYKSSINSTLSHFVARKIVDVDEENGILPYRGIREENPLDYQPYWVR